MALRKTWDFTLEYRKPLLILLTLDLIMSQYDSVNNKLLLHVLPPVSLSSNAYFTLPHYLVFLNLELIITLLLNISHYLK